jgi:hypothetical protein
LGIEATRAILYKEMFTVFEEAGTSVNYRHVGVLVDKICSRGRLMSVDRYGINKCDIGPLAKMSFEQTEDIALRAALFGERFELLRQFVDRIRPAGGRCDSEFNVAFVVCHRSSQIETGHRVLLPAPRASA